jgi:hypothetical protein
MTIPPLPPPPWAVREYFARRRPANLGRGFTEEQLAHNDSLWLDVVAGTPGAVRCLEVGKRPHGSLDLPAGVTHSAAENLRLCEACGHAIRRHGRPWSRFCGDACKQQAYRHRRAAHFPKPAAISGAARAKSRHPIASRISPYSRP